MADGVVDPHYQLFASASTTYPAGSPLYVVNSSTYPIPPWMANGPNSKWLSVQTVPGSISTGIYTYRTVFNLSGYNSSTASITGQWSMDDDGMDILINGMSTGFSYNGTNQFGFFHPFSISSGFLPGNNTLDFIVNNRIDQLASGQKCRSQRRRRAAKLANPGWYRLWIICRLAANSPL